MASDCMATHPTNQAVSQPSNQATQQPNQPVNWARWIMGPAQAGRQAGSDSADVDTDTDA